MTTGNTRLAAAQHAIWAVFTAVLWMGASPAAANDDSAPPENNSASGPTAAKKPQDDSAEARRLYEQGLTAMSQQRWAQAEVAFERAYAIKQHFQIAGNLGTCELELGKHAEAAEHLHVALTQLRDQQDREREILELESLLTAARAQCGTLEIQIEPSGRSTIEVRVDHRRLDWPQRLVFVEPGQHMIVARALDSDDRAQLEVDVQAGLTRSLTLQLGQQAGATPNTDADSPRDGWPTYPLWIGVAATVATAGAGIVARVIGSDAEGDADQQRDDIHSGQATCSAGCPEVLDRYADADRAYDASTGLFIAAGTLAAATIGTMVLLVTGTDDEAEVAVGLMAGPKGMVIGASLDF